MAWTHGFIDDSGHFTTVDPPGATETQLLGLNDNGIADGFAMIGGFQHGILYNSLTKMFTILDPPGSTQTTLNGLNNAGDVVGFFVDAAGNTDGTLRDPCAGADDLGYDPDWLHRPRLACPRPFPTVSSRASGVVAVIAQTGRSQNVSAMRRRSPYEPRCARPPERMIPCSKPWR